MVQIRRQCIADEKPLVKGLFLQLFEDMNHWPFVRLERVVLANSSGPDEQNIAISNIPNPKYQSIIKG
jgi:hypothetical protein